MKTTGKILILTVLIPFLISTTGCSKKDRDRSNEGNFFLTAAKDALPEIGSVTKKSLMADQDISAATEDSWRLENPLYHIFAMLREYDPMNDDGSVGIDNVYLLLYIAGTFFDDAMDHGTPIPLQHIEAPFNLGWNNALYDVAINDQTYLTGTAVRQEGTVNSALRSHLRYTGGDFIGTERFILQGSYDKASHVLSVDLLTFLDFDTKDIGMRINVTGNDSTHLFTVKYIKYATNEIFAYGVGHGISKGPDQYFLFKFSVGIEDAMIVNDGYYCIASSDTEADLRVMDPQGVTEIIPECAGYKAVVDGVAPFTRADLPSSPSDFNTGGTGIAPEGSMYLKFNNK